MSAPGGSSASARRAKRPSGPLSGLAAAAEAQVGDRAERVQAHHSPERAAAAHFVLVAALDVALGRPDDQEADRREDQHRHFAGAPELAVSLFRGHALIVAPAGVYSRLAIVIARPIARNSTTSPAT